MIIVGERINGTRKRIREAVIARDAELIEREATLQARPALTSRANAGTKPERDPRTWPWLVTTIQSGDDRPSCIDRPTPRPCGPVWGRTRPGPGHSVTARSPPGDGAQAGKGVRRRLVGLTLDDRGCRKPRRSGLPSPGAWDGGPKPRARTFGTLH